MKGMAFVRFVPVLVAACALAACGLEVVGTFQGSPTPDAARDGGTGGATDDASGGQDAAPDVPPVVDGPDACAGSTCGLDVPAGWSVVALAEVESPCPAGFTAKDVVQNPVAPPEACACTCDVSTKPSCTSATTVQTSYDDLNNAVCNSTQNALDAIPDAVCHNVNLAPGKHEEFPSPPPSGTAACKATNKADKTQVTSTAARVCIPPTCGDVCNAGAAYATCLVAPGDVACPGTGLTKHLVGASADVTCPACSCAASAAATCTGKWTLYSDMNCKTAQDTFAADTCASTSTNTVRSYRWTPDPIATSCTTTPAAGTATLLGTSTLCCKP